MTDVIQNQFDMSKTYEASEVEDKWYSFWMKKEYFKVKI